MDRNSRGIVRGNEPGLTAKNIGTVLDLLEANYGSRLYKDTDRKNVIALWSSMFSNDNPYEVLTAVKEYIETETFPPTIADIKKIMKRNRKNNAGYIPIEDVIAEANRESAKHALIKFTPELHEKHASRVADFLKPLTKIEIKIINKREEKKGLRFIS